MEERRRIQTFNQNFGRAVAEVERLRIPFIRIRFEYLKSFYEEVTEEAYTPDGLTNMLLGLKSKGRLPGDDHSPWAHFTGREKGLSEQDYLEVLYSHSQLPRSPLELFLLDFNKHLQMHRVSVKLVTNDIKMYWVLT